MDLTPYLALSPLVVPFTVLTYRWMKLRLIRHVYDKGGADDVEKVARAINPGDKRDLPPPESPGRHRAQGQIERVQPPEPPRALPPGQGDDEHRVPEQGG